MHRVKISRTKRKNKSTALVGDYIIDRASRKKISENIENLGILGNNLT